MIVIQQIVELLKNCGEKSWANAIECSWSESEQDLDYAKNRIRALYGGMGSFNDLVLHSPDGVPLKAENDELDDLRSQLYELARR